MSDVTDNTREHTRSNYNRVPAQPERSGISVSMPIETYQRTVVSDPNASAAGGVGIFALGVVTGVVVGVLLSGEVSDESTHHREPREVSVVDVRTTSDVDTP